MENFKDRFDNVIMEKLGVKKEEITPEAKFNDDLGADSLDMVELVMEFEKAFDIIIPDDDGDRIKNVADAEKYILTILNERNENAVNK